MVNTARTAQTFETKGVRPFGRPTLSGRLGMKAVGLVERLNRRCSMLGNPCVYDNTKFPWTQKLEAAWPAIREELDRLLARRDELPSISEISPDAESISTDRAWKTFILTGYGFRSLRNIALCPNTWHALQCVPGLITAMFSIFEPGKRLPAHRGPYNGVLRLHLGLLVPREHWLVGIRVGDRICYWREGSVLIFDDAYTHEAWNDSDSVRVVLFVDFVKPLRFPANLINNLLIKLASMSSFVRDCKVRQRAWEASFHDSHNG
jgi:beta-hydroxylase